MARKRLNTHFLTIAGIVLGVGALGLFAAYKILPRFVPQVKWIIRGTPTQHLQKAQVLYDQADYEKAAEEYKTALQLKGAPDAVLYTGLGDCYSHMVYKDTENLGRTIAC